MIRELLVLGFALGLGIGAGMTALVVVIQTIKALLSWEEKEGE